MIPVKCQFHSSKYIMVPVCTPSRKPSQKWFETLFPSLIHEPSLSMFLSVAHDCAYKDTTDEYKSWPENDMETLCAVNVFVKHCAPRCQGIPAVVAAVVFPWHAVFKSVSLHEITIYLFVLATVGHAEGALKGSIFQSLPRYYLFS